MPEPPEPDNRTVEAIYAIHQQKDINIINNIKDNMDGNEETGIRISKRLRSKIKKAAMMQNLTMVDYLDKLVPDTEIREIKREHSSTEG